VEAVTYRFAAHGAADLFQPYRTKEEVEAWKARDPILLLEQALRAAGLLDDERVEELRREAEEVVAAAVRYAEESPEPPPEELTRDVYAP
jgi:pyruvate dehydrogenase E1 component alpha subunit